LIKIERKKGNQEIKKMDINENLGGGGR